jgi:thiamine kinase-like enzyme
MATLLVPNKRTVIHGEYYPKNILYQKGVVRPVDWQTAAIAAGEIDLASLTLNWPVETVLECEREYQRARWPKYTNEDFRQVLGAARLYLRLCFLQSHHEWRKARGDMSPHFEQLRAEGERLGLL